MRIYSRDTNRGSFTVCVTHVVPVNDECSNAVALTSGTSCTATAGTTVNATQSLAAITCSAITGTADDDVWYKFTAVIPNHTVTVVGGSGINVAVDVRSGACNGTTSGAETVNLTGLTVGNTYYVRVYSRGSTVADQGVFGIYILHVPNDECAGAITLTSGTSCTPTTGTTTGATLSLGAIACEESGGTPDDDVWYKFTAVATTHTITVVGATGFDAFVDVRSGICNASTTIACADNTPNQPETVSLSGLTIGNTYFVRIYSNGSTLADRGTFTVCVTHPCPATLAVSGSISSGTVVKEALKITANNQVSGGIVTYKAAQSVTLQPGFRAIAGAGSVFQAILGGCP